MIWTVGGFQLRQPIFILISILYCNNYSFNLSKMSNSQTIFVEVNGTLRIVTKKQLFGLATRGIIHSKTKIIINEKESTAGNIKRYCV
jgi:hypothetical protein